jgi:hypothetical protein
MNLRRTVLKLLAANADARWGKGLHYFYEAVKKEHSQPVRPLEVMEVLWQLLSEGLIFIDYSQPAPDNWEWILSERGRRVALSDTDFDPGDPDGYLQALRANIPDLDDQIFVYVHEALRSYNSGAFLASSVMLGVASERAFQHLGESFATWLPQNEAIRFREVFDNPRQNYIAKFVEFRKRIEPRKGELPQEFADNMALTLDSVLDLLRINRNEAGHPTGRRVDEREAYINLQIFGRYLIKLHALRDFFVATKQGAKATEAPR